MQKLLVFSHIWFSLILFWTLYITICILLICLLWLSAIYPELQQPYQWHKFSQLKIPAPDKFRGEFSGDPSDAGDDTDDMPGDSRVDHHYVLEDGAAEEDVKGINTEVMNDKLMISLQFPDSSQVSDELFGREGTK